jgi:hypothetical protein
MEERFEYKAAPIGKERALLVGDELARMLDSSGQELARVRYGEVLAARFVESRTRYGVSRRLDLDSGGTIFRVPMGVNAGSEPSQEPLASFYRGCAAVLTRVAQARPELEVELGESKAIRWVYFVLGLLAVALGLGLPIAALATGVAGDKVAGALIPSLLLLLIGALLTSSNRPGKPLPRVSVERLAGTLREMPE